MPRLGEISLVVADYDEAIAFYVGKMGFALVDNIDQGGGRRWVVVRPGVGGASIVLAKADDERQRASIGNQAGGRVWLFLHSDDFAGDHARLVAAGVRFLEKPRHEPYGTVAVFEDLYGNRWDLIQRAA